MNIETRISVPHYVYLFYQRIAQQLGNITPEEVMADMLFKCAGTTAQSILNGQTKNNIT